jgi:hypothetical protein
MMGVNEKFVCQVDSATRDQGICVETLAVIVAAQQCSHCCEGLIAQRGRLVENLRAFAADSEYRLGEQYKLRKPASNCQFLWSRGISGCFHHQKKLTYSKKMAAKITTTTVEVVSRWENNRFERCFAKDDWTLTIDKKAIVRRR